MRHPEEDSRHRPATAGVPTRVIVRRRRWRAIRSVLAVLGLLGLAGFVIPGQPAVPVEGATYLDWDQESFWRPLPDGATAHKGIDISAAFGTPVTPATPGLLLYTARGQQGDAVAILGPKWRVHTYANLQREDLGGGFVAGDTVLGSVAAPIAGAGASHLHYSVVTLIPYPWRFGRGPQGWLRMVYLDPSKALGWSQEDAP